MVGGLPVKPAKPQDHVRGPVDRLAPGRRELRGGRERKGKEGEKGKKVAETERSRVKE